MKAKSLNLKESSSIEDAFYTPSTMELEIQFTSGPKMYLFPGVPAAIIAMWLLADSPGRFYHKEIKKYAV
jgi:hypothetical protein